MPNKLYSEMAEIENQRQKPINNFEDNFGILEEFIWHGIIIKLNSISPQFI